MEKSILHDHVTAFLHEHMTNSFAYSTTFTSSACKTNKMPASRFQTVITEDFLAHNENQNTLKKTLSHVKLLKQFLTEKHQGSREIFIIAAAKLDRYLSEFVINVREADGTEYEPCYLRGMISSFDRQLKRHKLGSVMISSAEFADTREALRLKQRHLKSQGNGENPLKLILSMTMTKNYMKLVNQAYVPQHL